MSPDEPAISGVPGDASAGDAEVARILDEYLADLEAGRPADPGRLMAEHPALASQLRACLDVMDLAGPFVEDPGPGAASAAGLGFGLRSTRHVDDGPTPRPRRHGPDDGEPTMWPGPPTAEGAWGRFQLLGEIARGGMGAVLKGRDPDLGRDLAIKVLLESHRDDPRVVRRFIEEARIGGRLQHPGIVPVYELGTSADRRPYLAMKLVEGQTLASMLAARAARGGPAGGGPPLDDHAHLLAIFGQICRTMAYVHARGVIHRDLKPSNIMVGEFGEVQVMDWGLAKDLGRGGAAADGSTSPDEAAIGTAGAGPAGGVGSQAGSVLGTPEYMAPEQARGEVEGLDERADVFGLGAILCELLTGRPPFTGDTRQEVRARAARGDLADAMGRLVACGADAELTSLATDCLAAEPGRRPRDAGEVARRISAHEAGGRERLRAAGLARAEAQARAEEALARAVVERSRRRRTVALAAAVLGLVILGGGGWVHLGRRRLDRAARVDRAASGVESLYAEARRAGDDPSRWIAAREAARALEGLLIDAIDEEARARLAALASEVARSAASAAADREMLAELTEIRGARGDDRDGTQTDARYAEAFRGAGMDFDGAPADRAAAGLATRPLAVRVALAAVLDDWAAVRRLYRRDQDGASRLAEVARRVDPDPWRDRLRRTLQAPASSERLASLRDLAKSAPADELPAESLVLLGESLYSLGDAKAAEAVFRDAVRSYPGDVWAHYDLAICLEGLSRREEAIRHYTAARALRPELGHLLAHALEATGETDGAITVLEDLARLRPEQAIHHVCLARLLEDRGRKPEARDALDRAIAVARAATERKPESPRARFDLGFALTRRGRHDEAIAEYQRALRLRPGFAAAYYNLGASLQAQGRLDPSIVAYRAALHFKGDPLAHTEIGTALRGQGKVAEAIAEYREGIRLRPDSAGAHGNLGAILCDKVRDYAGAEAEFREAIRLKPDFAWAHYCLGNVLSPQGKRDEAIAAYRTALRLQPDLRVAQLNLDGLLDRAKGDEAIAEARAALRRKPDDPEAHLKLGDALGRQGQADEATAELRTALRLRPDAAAHHKLGRALHARRKLDEAIAAYRTAIRLKPDDANAHHDLGRALHEQGKATEATAEFRAALRLKPDDAATHGDLGAALASQGRSDEAIAEYRTAIRLRPDFPEVHNNLGNALADQGRTDEAIAEYRTAIRLRPNLADARGNLARTLAHLGRLDEATFEFREAIRSRPGNAGAHYDLGNALWGRRKLDEAIAEYREALRLNPDYAEAHCNLGLVLRQKGRSAEALAELRRGHELGSKRPDWRYPSAEWVREAERQVGVATGPDRPVVTPAP